MVDQELGLDFRADIPARVDFKGDVPLTCLQPRPVQEEHRQEDQHDVDRQTDNQYPSLK